MLYKVMLSPFSGIFTDKPFLGLSQKNSLVTQINASDKPQVIKQKQIFEKSSLICVYVLNDWDTGTVF